MPHPVLTYIFRLHLQTTTEEEGPKSAPSIMGLPPEAIERILSLKHELLQLLVRTRLLPVVAGFDLKAHPQRTKTRILLIIND